MPILPINVSLAPEAPTIDEVLGAAFTSYRVRFVIVDENDNVLLDLTDRINHDRLVSITDLSARQERTVGAYDVTVGSVTVDNADGFWDAPPPSPLTSWYRQVVRVSLWSQAGDTPLGRWLVNDLSTDTARGTATISLVGLSKRLVDKQADRVRDGQDWYVNRPIGWLVQQLLQQAYRRDRVQGWVSQGLISTRYQIPLADPAARSVSQYGRPPEFDGSVWREAGGTSYGDAMLVIDDAAHPQHGKVLVGIDGDVWLWDPATDIWRRLGGFAGAQKVMHLFWVKNTAANLHFYVGVGWEIDRPTTIANSHRSGAKGGAVKFFYGLRGATDFALYTGEPANVWTGHYAIRRGGYNGTADITVVGGVSSIDDNGRFGVNIPLLAPHWVRYRGFAAGAGPPYAASLEKQTAWNTSGSLAAGENAKKTTAYWGMEQPGWHTYNGFDDHGNGDYRPLDHRSNCGQRTGAFAMDGRDTGSFGKWLHFFVVSWDNTNKRFKFSFWRLECDGGGFSSSVRDTVIETASQIDDAMQPYCLLADPASDTLWVVGAAWGEGIWSSGAPQSNSLYGMIYKHAYDQTTVGAGTRVWDSASATSMENVIPIEACFGASASWLAVSFLDTKAVGGNCWTAAVLDTTDTIPNMIDKKRITRGQPKGFVRDAAAGRVYWFEEGANVLVSADDDSHTVDALVEDAGLPPVEGDANLLAGLVYHPAQEALYGISGFGAAGQADAAIMDGPPTAKNYLWQFAHSLTDRIELADFSEMDVWEALAALAAVGDFVFGHDDEGRFFFKPRPSSSVISGTIKVRGAVLAGEISAERIIKGFGFGEVYNVAEITPSRAILAEPDGSVLVLPRAEGFDRDKWDGDVQVFQQSSKAQNVFLRCVQGGANGSPDDGAIASDEDGNVCVDFSPTAGQRYHKLRFSFLLFDRVVETQVVQSIVSADTSIKVPYQDAQDVVPDDAAGSPVIQRGDFVTIADVVERKITAVADDVASGTTTLTLESAVGADYAIGTNVIIRSFGNNRWSDSTEGVTETSASWSTATEGAEEEKEFRDVRHLTVGMILRIVSSAGVEDVRVTVVSDPTNRKVKVKRGAAGTPRLAHPAGAVVQAFWAPIQNSTWPEGTLFPVGGTTVSLRVNLPASEKPFAIGDSIEIVCAGLRLEEQDLSKVVSYNAESIARFDKIPWQAARETRFLTFRQAVQAARRATADYGWPHFLPSVSGPIEKKLLLGETYLVEDRTAFPPVSATGSPNGDDPAVAPDTTRAIAASVRGFSYSLLTDRMTWDLRAIRRHSW